MRRILIILLFFLLIGCEKDRCYECIATCTVSGYTGSSTSVICGTMSRSEARDMTMTTSSDGVECSVICTEQ